MILAIIVHEASTNTLIVQEMFEVSYFNWCHTFIFLSVILG
jgi:hypothetical protein